MQSYTSFTANTVIFFQVSTLALLSYHYMSTEGVMINSYEREKVKLN